MELALVNTDVVVFEQDITLTEVVEMMLRKYGGNKYLLCLIHAAPSMGSLSSEEFYEQTVALLLKAQIIAGWKLPEGTMLDMLIDQTKKFLFENYSRLNILELEYAIRRYGIKLPYYGSGCNLQLIDNAIDDYINSRNETLRYQWQAYDDVKYQRIAHERENNRLLEDGENGGKEGDVK